MIFNDFFRAIGQMDDPKFRNVLFLGIGLTIALLFGAYAGFLSLVEWATSEPIELPIVGPITWLGDLFTWGSMFLLVVLSMFLLIPVASAMTSLFLDDIAQAVEDRHYPHLPVPPKVSWVDAAKDTLSFGATLIIANVAALFLYAMLPLATPFIFFGLNGYLLGREYFQIAAMRREGRAGAKALRQRHNGEIWMAGVLMALPLTIPFVNLLIPVLGAATFTHLYHRLAAHSDIGDI